MKILVTAKRVPDPEQKVKLKGNCLDTSGTNWQLNQFDEYAVETALRLDGAGAQLAREMDTAEAEANSQVNLGHDYLLLGEADIFLRIRPQYDFAYTTMFIGREGHVLSVTHGAEARYAIRGDEGYVRAKVFSSNGGWAWTQPVHF